MDQTRARSKNYSVLKELVRFVMPYRKRMSLAAVVLVLTAATTLSIGLALQRLVDRGLIAQDLHQLNIGVLIIVGLILLMAIGTFVRFYLVSWLGERVSADMRKAVFGHIVNLHPSYFEANRSGEIMSRLTTDTTLIQNIIGSSLSMAMRSTLTLIGGVALLLITNLKLSLIVLSCVPLILLPILIFGRRVRALSRKSQDSIADVGTQAGEIIHQIKTVQSYTREAEEKLAFGREVERAFGIARQRIQQRAILIAAVILLVFGAISGMLWVGGTDVLSGEMTGGELGSFAYFAIMVAMSVATLSEVFGELQRASGATERLLELLRVEPLIQAPREPSIRARDMPAEIRFREVTFCYPSRPLQPALKQLTLTIEEGKSLALVGPSGAGKSTIFELLLRFYDPQSGEILLGDTPLRDLDPAELRRQIALVPQQPVLFTADVWHNIRYGRPDASDDEVLAAARAAHADEFIRTLPDGYDSNLGEQGVRLSGGQRQRIAIARAILKDPRILLLDEATSALDSESERHVQDALQKLMHNRTTVIIAHRLSTIQHVDKIAMLDQGQLVATGDHQTLLTSSPLYQRLSRLQFRDRAESPESAESMIISS